MPDGRYGTWSSEQMIRRARFEQTARERAEAEGEAVELDPWRGLEPNPEAEEATAHAPNHDAVAGATGEPLIGATQAGGPVPAPIDPAGTSRTPEARFSPALALGVILRRGIWVVLGVAIAAGGWLFASDTVEDLKVGDCFVDPGHGLINDVDIIDCAEPHDLELFAMVPLAGMSLAYPGEKAVEENVLEECIDRFPDYVGHPFQTSDFWADSLYPTEDGWDSGDKTGFCLVYLGGETGDYASSTGSARNARR